MLKCWWVLAIQDKWRISRKRAGYKEGIAGAQRKERISGPESTELPLEDEHRKIGQEIDQRFAVIKPLGCFGNNKPAAIVRRSARNRPPAIQTVSEMARHTTDAEKTLYRVGGLPHDADAASPKRIKVPLQCSR